MGKTGGGRGTNQYRIRGQAVHRSTLTPFQPITSDSLLPATRVIQANDTDTPSETLNALSYDPDDQVRIAVASNLATSGETLEHLADNSGYIIRRAVAINPNTPIPVLNTLAMDPDPWVTAGVASNPHLPPEILAAMSLSDRQPQIALANDSRTSPEVLDILAKHPDGRFCRAVIAHPNTLPLTMHALSLGMTPGNPGIDILALEVAKHISTSSNTLRWLATRRPPDIKIAVAGNHNTPGDTLATLATNVGLDQRYHLSNQTAIAGNPNTPIETLVNILSDHTEPDVRRAVLDNPSTPQHVRAIWTLSQ